MSVSFEQDKGGTHTQTNRASASSVREVGFSCVYRSEISPLAISAWCRNMAASTSSGGRDKQSGNTTLNDGSETESKEFCPGFKDVDSFVKV